MYTKKFLGVFNGIETVLNAMVRMVVNIFTFAITEVTPLVAPLPPAFSIYVAMHERLHVPPYVAIIAAAAIEITGMFSSKVSIRCYQWNKARLKSEQSVPQALSIFMTGVFFVVVLLLSFTVELAPALTALVIPGFVLIAISVYINLAIHTNLDKLETDKAATLELREEKNGLAAQVRTAKNELQKLTAQAGELAQQVKNGRSELAWLRAEIAAAEKAKTALTAEVDQLQKLTANSQNGGQNGGQLSANGQKLDSFGPQNLARANQSKQDQIETRRAKLAALLAKNDQLTNRELADQLGVSLGTIKSDKKALNGVLK